MDISVIIPTYKPKDYIWECLDSLKNQTLDKSSFEIILVLNGCNEPWHSKIEKWLCDNKDFNAIFIQTDEPGVSNARNIGIDHVKGKYVTFIDDDDYVSVDYLTEMLKTANAHPDTVVISNIEAFNDVSGKVVESYYIKKTYQKLLTQQKKIDLFHARSIFNGPCMKLLPSSFIQGNYFNVTFKNSEDALYIYQISRTFNNIVLASEKAIYYRRIRKNSAVTIKRSMSDVIKNEMRFIREVIKIYSFSPFKYNLLFTLSRIAASIKTVLISLYKLY